MIIHNRFKDTMVLLLLLLLLAAPANLEGSGITANVIYRTFQIRMADSVGTAFTIDREKKQYLVTARHVVEDIVSGDEIEIYHKKRWKNIAIKVVGVGAGKIDIAVLACPIQLSPSYPLEASLADLVYGQSIYFLGFPFGYRWGLEEEHINRGFPLPFVKSGIVSAVLFGPSSKIWIDGHVNRGFSGGPVIFRPNAQASGEYRVAGVVVSYPLPTSRTIVDEHGDPIVDRHGKPFAYFQENPGFVIAINISHAIDLIQANPIGFELPVDEDAS